MSGAERDPELDRDWQGVLKGNLLVTALTLGSAVYAAGAVWIVSAANLAWGQGWGTAVLVLMVAMYAGVLVRIVLELRKLRRHPAPMRGVCAACGYDLRGLEPGAVCPECGTGHG